MAFLGPFGGPNGAFWDRLGSEGHFEPFGGFGAHMEVQMVKSSEKLKKSIKMRKSRLILKKSAKVGEVAKKIEKLSKSC